MKSKRKRVEKVKAIHLWGLFHKPSNGLLYHICCDREEAQAKRVGPNYKAVRITMLTTADYRRLLKAAQRTKP